MNKKQGNYDEHILTLIAKYQKGIATEDEIRQIDFWYDNPLSSEKYADGMSDFTKAKKRSSLLENIYDEIGKRTVKQPQLNSKKIIRAVVAVAAILLVALGAGFILIKTYLKHDSVQSLTSVALIKPAPSKALLTLSDGRQIVLNDAKAGVLANQGDATITKNSNNNIIYNTGTSLSSKVEYNTMSTLRGGEYHLVLADGTNVWLNAASSIRYPTSFPGKERIVEVSGEAYFEVAHDLAKPFKVVSKGQTIEVLGTHFNVNAYTNEPDIKTTLLQGSVKVTAYGIKNILKPGQQAAASVVGTTVLEVDTKEVVAWKEGYFEFSDADIQTVMRELSRWYDVEVVFEGKIPSETFTGRVSKFLDLNQVLTLVKSPKIHIITTGRRIMIKE